MAATSQPNNPKPNPFIALGRLGGLVRSERKIRASQENGRKGGRPKKRHTKLEAQLRARDLAELKRLREKYPDA